MRATIAKYWAIPLLRRLFIGAGWGVVGSGFSRLLGLTSTIIIARILGVENFGQLMILQSTLGMFGIFAGLGLGVVATKFTAELKVRNAQRLGRILTLIEHTAIIGGVLITIILILNSNIIAIQIMHVPHLAGMIALASISVVFATVDGYNNAALLGFEAVRQSVLGTLIAGLLSIPLSIILTWHYGLQGAVYGIVLASILQCSISNWVLGKMLKKHSIKYNRVSLVEWKILRDYALPALLGGVMVAPVHWLCQVLLINTPNGVVEMAILGIGLQWYQAVYFFPLAFGRIVLPVITDAIAGGQHKNANLILKTSIIANAIIALPVALVIIILSHWIMKMYGIYNTNAWLVLSLTVTAATISATCAPVGQILIAKGNLWIGWLMNLGWALIFISASYSLLSFGAVGVATGLALAYFVHTIWTSIWVLRNFKRKEI